MDDRTVYLTLSALADELAKLADQAESHVGQAALTSCAQMVGGTAKVVYEHALSGEEQ